MKHQPIKVPAGLKPKVSFKITAHKQYWFRVHVHEGVHLMRAYMAHVLVGSGSLTSRREADMLSHDAYGCCSCPPFLDADPDCLGEINLYGPWLEIAAHEIQHAVQATLAVIEASPGVPTKRAVVTPRADIQSRKLIERDIKKRGDPEVSAEIAESLMLGMIRGLARKKLLSVEYNKEGYEGKPLLF